MAACQIEPRLEASFKGVSFYCLTGASAHGRRGAEGEFPFGETTAYADLGVRIRKFSLKARFAGPTYIQDTSAFIAACESPGSGELVHPTRGVFTCGCLKADVSEDYESADGVSEVSLEFVEDQGNGMSLAAFAGVQTDGAVAYFLGALAAGWDMSQVEFYAVGGLTGTAAAVISFASQQILAACGPNAAAGASVSSAALSALSDLALASAGDAAPLQSGATLSGLLGEAFATIDSEGASAASKFSGALALANWAAQSSTTPGAAGSIENLLFSTVRVLAASYLARAAQEAGKTTLDAALKQIGQISTILNEEEAAAIASCSNAALFTIRQLYASTVTALFNLAYLNPPIVTYQLVGPMPSLVAAFEVYGDAKQFAAIEAMNPMAPPWAVGPQVYATKQ
jgi:prophage DNA circulation protein